MTLNLSSDVVAGLTSIAAARGMSIEQYLQELVSAELSRQRALSPDDSESALVKENGLLVYRTGKPLPVPVVDEAIRQSREERARHILDSSD